MLGITGYYLTPEDSEDFDSQYVELRGAGKNNKRIDFLYAYINDIKAGLKGDPTEPVLLALTANARRQLSIELAESSQKAEAIEQIRTALGEVMPTGFYNVIHKCLRKAGDLHWELDDYETSAAYYQRALAYTSPVLTSEFSTTLWYLARNWSRPETIDRAVLVFDWMLLLEPRNIGTFCDKYTAMARFGRIKDVEIAASSSMYNTCSNCAAIVAANFALKDRDKTLETARIGFKMARREQRSSGWVREFGKVLQGIGEYGAPWLTSGL